MNISTALALYSKKLSPAYSHQEVAINVAWWLLEHAFGKTRAQILLERDIPEVINTQMNTWIELIIQEHVPIQYILGWVPFLDLSLAVQHPILIPRPETEEWCGQLIETLKLTTTERFDFLDLCSGTGCIALSVAHAFPQAHVVASDINPQACSLIEHNKIKNNILNCTVIESDLFTNITNKFSIIAANPPYITPGEWQELEPRVKLWESPQALVAEREGLELIEKIITQAPHYLEKPLDNIAQVWIEIGHLQGAAVIEIFKKACYKKIEVLKDYYGKDRIVTGSLW